MRLEGRVAIVTGGTRGIGKGIALCLARAGAELALVHRRDDEAAQNTAQEIEALGRKALLFKSDVSDYPRAQETVARVVETFGKVDILVNNAGMASQGLLVADTDPEEVLRVFKVHTLGAFNFTKAVLPYMRKGKRGDIIFISSATAIVCEPTYAPYVMAKMAIEGLAKCLAQEEKRNGLRVNVVAPGVVETEMARRWAKVRKGLTVEDLRAATPFGRLTQPEDVGNLCVFLASEEAEQITGQVIALHGGTLEHYVFPP